MRTWKRAIISIRCGGCPHQIARGDAMLVITIVGVTRPLIRCATCAGEAPPALPPLGERVDTTRSLEPISRIAERVVPDGKLRQLGGDA